MSCWDIYLPSPCTNVCGAITETEWRTKLRWDIIAAAVIGAVAGSRILGFLDQLAEHTFTWTQVLSPGGGKTVVGGLLGGWAGVEIIKRTKGIRNRTGDLFAIPLCVGIAVGRLGCLLAGVADNTYGVPTSLPWGIDFGDGIARHPTQAYEILFLCALAFTLRSVAHRPHVQGSIFTIFVASYLSWRLIIDFLKPETVYARLSAIQWASICGIACVVLSWPREPKGETVRRVYE